MQSIKLILSITLMTIMTSSAFAVVTLDTVYANQVSGLVQVDWQTSAEINNDYFTVERSTDSVIFTSIGTVLGASNSAVILNYGFTDSNVVAGQTYYYRIVNTDFAGMSYFSNVIEITTTSTAGIAEQNTTSFQLYPNPMNDMATLTFENAENSNYTLTLFDINGQLVQTYKDITSGHVIIERAGLNDGLYFFKLSARGQTQTEGKLTIN